MTDELAVALAIGALLGVGGVARTVVPVLALLAVAAFVTYVVVAQPSLEGVIRQFGTLVRGHAAPIVAGLGGAVAGQLLHALLRTRAA